MQDDRPDQRWLTSIALPVSAGLHLLVLALLIFGLPHALEQPTKDEAVEVALVPPPEPAAEPPAPEAKVDPPAEEKPEPPPAATLPAPPSAAPSFNPVVQFGEKDSGPKQSLEGEDTEEETESPPDEPAPDELSPDEEADAEDTAPADEETPELSLPNAAALPTARPAKPPVRPSAPKLTEARRLFSPAATGESQAVTAMGDLPRSVRGSTLCVSELREQLLHHAPPYFADLLPSSPLGKGNVIDVPDVAFRSNGQWRDLSYRCEVDADATRVVSFAFRIGEVIPPSEWRRRGLPAR
mgnify:CR=1 FL=1|jgi:hypothetical protein